MSEPWEDYASSGTTTTAEPGPWEDFEAESKPWEDFEPPTLPGVNYSPLDPGSKPLGLVDDAHEVMQIPGRYIGGKIAQRIPGTPDQPLDVEKSIIPWMDPAKVPPAAAMPQIPGSIPPLLMHAGLVTGAGLGQFVTSPQGVAEGLMAKAAPGLVAAKWLTDMVHGISKAVPAAWEAFQRGDMQGVADNLAGAAAMGAGVGHISAKVLGELKTAGIEPRTGGQTPPNAPPEAGSPPVVSGQPPIPPAATPEAAAPPVVVTPDVLESLFQDLTRNQIAREPGPPPIPQQVPADLIPPTEPAIPERPKPKPAKPVANFQDIDGALNDFLEGQGLPRNTWDQGERQQLHALVRILVDNVGGASRRMILSFFDQPDFVMALKAHGLLPMDWEAKQRPQRGFGSSLVGITDQVPTNPFESMPIDQKKAIYDQIAAERAKNDREKRERVMRKIMEGAPIQREDFHSLQSDPHVGPMLASYSVSGNWAFPTLPIVIPPAQQKPTEGTRPEANAPAEAEAPVALPGPEPLKFDDQGRPFYSDEDWATYQALDVRRADKAVPMDERMAAWATFEKLKNKYEGKTPAQVALPKPSQKPKEPAPAAAPEPEPLPVAEPSPGVTAAPVAVPEKGPSWVVYHSSPNDFDTFDTSAEGSHFGTLEQASNLRKPGKNAPKGYILSINSVLRVPDMGTWTVDGITSNLHRMGVFSDADADAVYSAYNLSDAGGFAKIKELLKGKGYDGFVYDNEQEGKGDSYVAFDSGQIKPADAPKVKRGPLWVRPRSDGVPDILDDIQEHGGITAPGPDAGGEYDGYREAMVGAASMLRRRKGAGLTVDKMVEQLQGQNWPRVTTPDELWSAIKAAVDQRRELAATGGGHEAQTQRFWDAVQSPNSKSGLEQINVQDLNVGDTFRIRGPGISHEELTVTHLDPDDMSIQVKDGPKLGVQDIPDGTEIWVKRGSHVKAHPTPTAPPPVPKLPWQMTKKELAEHWKDKSFSEITSDLKRWGLWREGADNYNVAHHRNAVAKAIKEGHPVPANVLADYPDLRPVPKLRQGERGTGDLLQGENAPFNLAGEKATDFERVAREKAAAEKTTREAKELEAKQQPTLPGADPIDEALTKAIDATNPGRVLGSGDVNLGLAKLPKWLTQEAAHGALKVVRATYRAGKKFAEAVEAGVQWLKDHGLAGFNADDVRNWLGGMGITESGIVRHAEMSKTGKATGANWKAELRNRPGVGKDEWALMSVDDLDDGKTYTKQEVTDYLRGNEVQVKDVTLSDVKPDFARADARAEEIWKEWERSGESHNHTYADAQELAVQGMERTHFSTYQLPGAKEGSYREVLLTVPKGREPGNLLTYQDWLPEQPWYQKWKSDGADYYEAKRLYDEWYIREAQGRDKLAWRDGHQQYSDIPNPVVRLRFNERTTADGKRMLFLEEVQPPQKGQFEKMPAMFQKQWREIAFKWALRHAAENGFDSVGWTTGEQQAARYDLSKQVTHVEWMTQPLTSVYPELRGAKHVNINTIEGPVAFYVKDGKVVNAANQNAASLVGKSLDDVIGKDIAKKISAEGSGRIEGEGLKVGGEGLKKLYDTDFRNVVNNLPAVKKAGQKVGIETLETRKPYHIIDADSGDTVGQYSTYEEAYRAVADLGPGHEITSPATPKLAEEERGGQPVHSLDITLEMRESAQKFPHEAELEQPRAKEPLNIAALRMPDGEIVHGRSIRGATHGEAFDRAISMGYSEADAIKADRGYMNESGSRFLTKDQIADIAAEEKRRRGIGGAMQSAVERGGEAGAVRIPTKKEILDAMGDLPDRFRSAVHWSRMKGRGITDRIKRSGIYDFVSSSKDSADNRAKIIANSAGNSVRHALNRAFGVAPKAVLKTRNPQREMGLTMVVEAGGDRVKLAEMRNTLTSADLEGMPRIWKKTALRAIDFADAHWDKLKPVADMYQKITDWENRFENANGIPTLYRQGGYVFHAQDVETGMGRESTGPATDTGGAPAPFRHVRDHQTYADSIAGGVVPDSINAVDLLNKRIALGQRVVNYGEWRDALRSVVDPATEQPLVVDPIVRKRADGTQDVTAPPGYQLVDFGNRKIALHNGYTGLFLDLTAKSHIPADLMKGMSASKHWQLLVDTYHLGRLAFWNSTSRLGLPSYARGHLLLENSVNEIQKMVQLKEVPAEMGRNLIESKQLLDEGLRSGLNVGNVGDNMYRDWIQGIPVVGTFNKWLFNKYQRGAMAEVYLIERQRMAKMYPELSRQELSRRVAKFVNTRFGNIQSQGWIKSRTGQDLARIVFLAPQWNETLIRSELGAVKDIVGGVYSSVKNRRLQMGPMGRAVGTAALGMFIANQLINYATRGKPTWENEEETPGAKLSAWVPDWIGGGPGFFLHPLAIPAEIVKHIQQGTARTGNWDDAVSEFLGGRFSSLMRGAYTFAANKTPMGVELKPGHRTAGAVGEALPMPIVGNALYRGVAQMVTGEHREAFPGQFQKQIMQSAGIKSEGAPDPGRRIGVLVSKFELARGIPMKPSHEESVYRNLTTALRVHNMTAANEALGEILKVVKANGETRELRDVIDYYRAWVRRPFTGSKALERQFVDGLNAAQKEVYDRARDNRERIAQQAFDLIDAHQP